MSLIGNVLKPLAKSILLPLGLTAAASTIDAAIQKKIHKPGTTTLIVSNEEMEDIMKIVKSLEKSGLLIKGISGTTKNEAKKQKGGFFRIILGTLVAILLENLLTGQGRATIIAGEDRTKAVQDFLVSPHPLPNFEIQKCYQTEPKFHGVYSRNNLPKVKEGTYIINLDE